MNSLLNPKSNTSHLKLDSIKIDDKDGMKINRDSEQSPSLFYSEELVISF